MRYRIAADYELMLRFYTEGVKFLFLNEVLANFRYGGISTVKVEETAEEGKKIKLSYIKKFAVDKEVMIKQIEKRYNIARFVPVIKRTPSLLIDYFKEVFPSFNNEIIIWGTGIWGNHCYDLLNQCDINIAAFVDNDKEKWGIRVNQVPIKSPEILKTMRGNVLIAVRYNAPEIIDQLKSYNNSNLYWITIDDVIVDVM